MKPPLTLFVHTITSFLSTHHSHRDEVYRTAQILKSDFERFQSIPERLFNDYFRLHDLPKVMSVRELSALGYKGEKSISARLYEFCGRSEVDLCRSDLSKFQRVRSDLNYYEGLIKEKFRLQLNVRGPTFRRLGMIEDAADSFVTGLTRGREMNFVASAKNGERYLQGIGKSEAASLARHLATHYSNSFDPRN